MFTEPVVGLPLAQAGGGDAPWVGCPPEASEAEPVVVLPLAHGVGDAPWAAGLHTPSLALQRPLKPPEAVKQPLTKTRSTV